MCSTFCNFEENGQIAPVDLVYFYKFSSLQSSSLAQCACSESIARFSISKNHITNCKYLPYKKKLECCFKVPIKLAKLILTRSKKKKKFQVSVYF